MSIRPISFAHQQPHLQQYHRDLRFDGAAIVSGNEARNNTTGMYVGDRMPPPVSQVFNNNLHDNGTGLQFAIPSRRLTTRPASTPHSAFSSPTMAATRWCTTTMHQECHWHVQTCFVTASKSRCRHSPTPRPMPYAVAIDVYGNSRPAFECAIPAPLLHDAICADNNAAGRLNAMHLFDRIVVVHQRVAAIVGELNADAGVEAGRVVRRLDVIVD